MSSRTWILGGPLLVVFALCIVAAPALAADSYEDYDGITLSGNGIWTTCHYLSEKYYNLLSYYASSSDDFQMFILASPPGADYDLYLFDSTPELVSYSVSSTVTTDSGNQLDWIGYARNQLPSGYYYVVPFAYSGHGTYMYVEVWKNNYYFY
ncbi:MAG: hypothetical protein ABFC89_13405 [Methanospirillum sp.]